MSEKVVSGTKRDCSLLEKVKSGLYDAAHDAFIRFLPSDELKLIPQSFMYPIGFFILFASMGLFLGFLVYGYDSVINTTYLAPLNGETSDKYCSTVEVANTGDFLATQSGLWEGASGFVYSESAYWLSVTSWTASYAEYQRLMALAYITLVEAGQYLTKHDLSVSLMFWMSFAFVPSTNDVTQRLALYGTPLVIFDRQKQAATISNVYGDCNASSTAAFNPSTGLMTLEYNYYEYIHNHLCNTTADPVIFGYLPTVDGETFTLSMDIRSLITGLAINLGILSIDEIVQITAFNSLYEYNGVIYNVSSYYDPKYPNMQPVTCLRNFNMSQCVMIAGT